MDINASILAIKKANGVQSLDVFQDAGYDKKKKHKTVDFGDSIMKSYNFSGKDGIFGAEKANVNTIEDLDGNIEYFSYESKGKDPITGDTLTVEKLEEYYTGESSGLKHKMDYLNKHHVYMDGTYDSTESSEVFYDEDGKKTMELWAKIDEYGDSEKESHYSPDGKLTSETWRSKLGNSTNKSVKQYYPNGKVSSISRESQGVNISDKEHKYYDENGNFLHSESYLSQNGKTQYRYEDADIATLTVTDNATGEVDYSKSVGKNLQGKVISFFTNWLG